MKNIFSIILDSIFRKKCYFCSSSEENTIMCSKCFNSIELLPNYTNRIIKNKKVYCACVYKEVIQKLIRGIKYHKQKDLAYFQAKLMYKYWLKIGTSKIYTVVPIPLSKERLKERKYNHMQLVAEEFCKLTGYNLNNKLVYRIRDTKPQYKLTRQERMENLNNAFSVNEKFYNGSPILLLDDICTTGSTFETIIKELEKYNITNVTCFATSTPKLE